MNKNDKKLRSMVKAAYLEFEKDPMDKYYSHPLIGGMSRLRVEKIVEELGRLKGKYVLDVGCEAGYVSIKIMENGAYVVPFDICKPALVKFKQRLTKIKNKKTLGPFVATVHKIPLKSNCVDSIVCSEVIEHVPYLELLFKEMIRVLKNGGKIIITFPNEKMREKIYPIAKLFGINTNVGKEVTLFSYTLKEIERKLKKFYKIEKKYGIPSFLFPLTYIIVAKK